MVLLQGFIEARRKAAQTAAAATSSHAAQADQAETSNFVAEQGRSTPTVVSEEDIIEDENKIENLENEETVQLAEKLNEKYEYPICDFSNEWENGLRVHLARKHSKLEQLDGFSKIDDLDKKYEDTVHYWKTGWLGTMYHSFLTANDIINSIDIPEDLNFGSKENSVWNEGGFPPGLRFFCLIHKLQAVPLDIICVRK